MHRHVFECRHESSVQNRDRPGLLEKSVGQPRAGPGNDVAADQFADLRSGRCTGFDRGANAADVAADDRGDQAATQIDAFGDFDVGGFGHRVGGFDQGDQPTSFNQSDSVIHDDSEFVVGVNVLGKGQGVAFAVCDRAGQPW